MKTFSRLSLFTIVCLGFALMLVAGTAEVHAVLQVEGISDVYQRNDIVEAIFTAFDADGSPAAGATLTITHSGLTDVTISNGGRTDWLGAVAVTGKIIGDTEAYIQAEWLDWTAKALFDIYIRDVPEAVFHRYSTTFRHPDVHKFFLMSYVLLKIQRFKRS